MGLALLQEERHYPDCAGKTFKGGSML